MPELPGRDEPARPTRARWVVLTFLCALSAILYIDRICFSQAVTALETELKLTKDDISWVMVAFTVAYGVFEIPVGRWGDRIGPRRVLPRIAICWSIFTALTGACFGLWQLIIVRFLFGMGEAGAYPNTARVLARWFPDEERARAQGRLLAASQVGLILAMPVAAWVIELWGWRWMFVVFGLLGVAWAAAFYAWFRDDPAEHPAVNAAEREQIGISRAPAVTRHDPIPWALVRWNPSIWALCGSMVCGAFNSYFYYSWFPSYLKQARGVENLGSGWLMALLYSGAALGMLVGGALTGRTVQNSLRRDSATRLQGGLACVLAAASLWLAVRCESAGMLVAFAALSAACMASTQPLFWSCIINVSGRHIGSLFGLVNMVGLLGAASSQRFVGVFTSWREQKGLTGRAQWDPVFDVYVVALLICGACWAMYRTRSVEPEHLASGEQDRSSHENALVPEGTPS